MALTNDEIQNEHVLNVSADKYYRSELYSEWMRSLARRLSLLCRARVLPDECTRLSQIVSTYGNDAQHIHAKVRQQHVPESLRDYYSSLLIIQVVQVPTQVQGYSREEPTLTLVLEETDVAELMSTLNGD
jgi:hypothetical protein